MGSKITQLHFELKCLDIDTVYQHCCQTNDGISVTTYLGIKNKHDMVTKIKTYLENY